MNYFLILLPIIFAIADANNWLVVPLYIHLVSWLFSFLGFGMQIDKKSSNNDDKK